MAKAPEHSKTAENGGNTRRLSDIAYDRFLENLFAKRVPTGAFVSQNQLVKLLDVPVAPLRDALRVLEAEGVLKIHPRSGIEIVKPGLELTKSTYQFRAILERAAVRVFAETGEEDVINEIYEAHNDLAQRIEESGLDDAAIQNIETLENLLHDNIISSLQNPLIDSNYKRMHNYLRLVRLDRRLTAPLALRSLHEHIEILEACRARDAENAEMALQRHFTAALQRHMGLY